MVKRCAGVQVRIFALLADDTRPLRAEGARHTFSAVAVVWRKGAKVSQGPATGNAPTRVVQLRWLRGMCESVPRPNHRKRAHTFSAGAAVERKGAKVSQGPTTGKQNTHTHTHTHTHTETQTHTQTLTHTHAHTHTHLQVLGLPQVLDDLVLSPLFRRRLEYPLQERVQRRHVRGAR